MTEHEFIRHYDAYSDALFRHSYFRVFERERARDLVQETFTRTWGYLLQGKQIDNMRAFLYRVLNNLIVDESRKKRPLSLDELEEKGLEPSEDHRERIAANIEAKVFLRMLDEVSEKHRDVIIMRHVDDLGPKDIAAITGESENTVSVRIHRAMQELRTVATRHGYPF